MADPLPTHLVVDKGSYKTQEGRRRNEGGFNLARLRWDFLSLGKLRGGNLAGVWMPVLIADPSSAVLALRGADLIERRPAFVAVKTALRRLRRWPAAGPDRHCARSVVAR